MSRQILLLIAAALQLKSQAEYLFDGYRNSSTCRSIHLTFNTETEKMEEGYYCKIINILIYIVLILYNIQERLKNII